MHGDVLEFQFLENSTCTGFAALEYDVPRGEGCWKSNNNLDKESAIGQGKRCPCFSKFVAQEQKGYSLFLGI